MVIRYTITIIQRAAQGRLVDFHLHRDTYIKKILILFLTVFSIFFSIFLRFFCDKDHSSSHQLLRFQNSLVTRACFSPTTVPAKLPSFLIAKVVGMPSIFHSVVRSGLSSISTKTTGILGYFPANLLIVGVRRVHKPHQLPALKQATIGPLEVQI